jgi:hypothetical protein
MMSITSLGTRHILTYFAHQAKRIDGSYSGMHGVCLALIPSQKPIDSRSESRYIQQCPVKISPVQTSYSPDGRSLLFASAGHQLFFMTLGKEGEETKEQWHVSDKDAVRTFQTLHWLS